MANFADMQYYRYEYADQCVRAEVAKFVPADGGTVEYSAIITVSATNELFASQARLLAESVQRLAADLAAHPLFVRLFLSDPANQGAHLPQLECAVSAIGQSPLDGSKIAAWALLWSGPRPTLHPNGLWVAQRKRYAHLWCAGAASADKNAELATMAIFGNYQIKLKQENCSLLDNCMRTWFFVRNIDENYRGMAAGRNSAFRCAGLSPETHFIASTGIAGANIDPAVVVTMDAYAVAGLKTEQVQYLHASDFFNPTIEYGVAFERGTAIDYGDRRHVLISGTASINNRGQVVYPGDIMAQTRRMTRNVEALLEEAEAAWSDVNYIIIYLRDLSDYALVRRYAEETFPNIPCIIVQAAVCRPGWLIEMECAAIVERKDIRFLNY